MSDREVRGIGWWVFFGLANALFSLFWVRLGIHIFKAWHVMGGRLQIDAATLAIMSAVLWFCLLRERKSIACLCVASFTFDAVIDLVARLL